jgi:hypothetical protein
MRQPLSAFVLPVHSSAQPMQGLRRRQRFGLAPASVRLSRETASGGTDRTWAPRVDAKLIH